MIVWFPISYTMILFVILGIAGIAMQIVSNIGEIVFNIVMCTILLLGSVIHVNQIKDSIYGATKLTGLLSILSTFQTIITFIFLKSELHWEINTAKVIICSLIFIVIIIINSFACYLTDEKRNNFKMSFITLGVCAAVALSGYIYFVHEDKNLAKNDIEETYTYIVTQDNAEIYNVVKGTSWDVVNKKEIESDTIGDDIIGYCKKGDILVNEHDGIGGMINAQKIRTESGVVGYILSGKIKPYEYKTRYQLQYENN